MNIELLPGLTNVVRFPLEERVAPSMELIAVIEPDVREVLSGVTPQNGQNSTGDSTKREHRRSTLCPT